MLTLDTFNRSPFHIQKKETFGKGEFFDVNSSADKLISLYYYNEFLVEVHFNPFVNEIECFFAISLFDAADRYIDLSEIFVEA
jgi:hypothetical protein